IIRSIRDDLDKVSFVNVKHTSSKLTVAKNKVRTAESEVEEAQRAVQQAPDVFDELNNEYHKALEDLIDAQKAISTKDRVASQNSINSGLAKLSELRQDMRSAKEALANAERQCSEAQNNLKRQITELERANDEHAKCLEIYRPLFVAFTRHTSQLAIIFRPFSQAWLLNEARLLKSPSILVKLGLDDADSQELKQYNGDTYKDRRYYNLGHLRGEIQNYLKESGLSMTTATLSSAGSSVGTSTGLVSLLSRQHPTQRVTFEDLLRSSYSDIYESITQFDDDHLGLLIRMVLERQSALYTLSKYTDQRNPLLGVTDHRYFSGPNDDDGNKLYWAGDLTVALVTLRFLHSPTAIDPKSKLFETLSDYKLTFQIVRAHIWAIGTELDIPDVDFLVTDVGKAEYSRIKSCASDLGWKKAKKVAYSRASSDSESCSGHFYTASPIRLGPNQSLIVQVVSIDKQKAKV
ncbi:hypothetical protein IWQ60_004290, partial [Tieghemiomyces parasiticus]